MARAALRAQGRSRSGSEGRGVRQPDTHGGGAPPSSRPSPRPHPDVVLPSSRLRSFLKDGCTAAREGGCRSEMSPSRVSSARLRKPLAGPPPPPRSSQARDQRVSLPRLVCDDAKRRPLHHLHNHGLRVLPTEMPFDLPSRRTHPRNLPGPHPTLLPGPPALGPLDGLTPKGPEGAPGACYEERRAGGVGRSQRSK